MNPMMPQFGMTVAFIWMLVVLASVIITIRGMLALAKIPARLEAIERAIRETRPARDDGLG